MDRNDNATRLTLLIKLKGDDNNTAWKEFTAIYQPFIYNLIRRMDFHHHDSEDLSQTVLSKVWQKIDMYSTDNKSGSFRRWLATITRNTVRDFIKTKKNFITNRNSVEYEDYYKGIEESKLPVIEELARKEWVIFVTNLAKKNVFETLSDTKRRIFDMSTKEIPIKEIAKELKVTETLVYIHRREVFNKMKQEINRLNHEL